MRRGAATYKYEDWRSISFGRTPPHRRRQTSTHRRRQPRGNPRLSRLAQTHVHNPCRWNSSKRTPWHGLTTTTWRFTNRHRVPAVHPHRRRPHSIHRRRHTRENPRPLSRIALPVALPFLWWPLALPVTLVGRRNFRDELIMCKRKTRKKRPIGFWPLVARSPHSRHSRKSANPNGTSLKISGYWRRTKMGESGGQEVLGPAYQHRVAENGHRSIGKGWTSCLISFRTDL